MMQIISNNIKSNCETTHRNSNDVSNAKLVFFIAWKAFAYSVPITFKELRFTVWSFRHVYIMVVRSLS